MISLDLTGGVIVPGNVTAITTTTNAAQPGGEDEE